MMRQSYEPCCAAGLRGNAMAMTNCSSSRFLIANNVLSLLCNPSGAFVRGFGRTPLPYCTSHSCHFPPQPPSTHNRICTRPPPRHLKPTPMKMKERQSGVKYVKVLKVAGSVRNGKSDVSGHHLPSPNVVTACDARQTVLVRSLRMNRMRTREEMLD